MNAIDARKAIQRILDTPEDGVIGPKSMARLESLIQTPDEAPWPIVTQGEAIHEGWATSFADPADVRAFKACKSEGKSDEQCFAVGDNGIGFTGLDCTDESMPYVAVPFEDWHDKFGSATAAQKKPILVTIMGVEHQCLIGDTMPHKANITNGAVIDMAPGARKLWGLSCPLKVKASWRWP